MVFVVNKCHVVINAKILATMVLVDVMKAWRLAADAEDRRSKLLVGDKPFV